MREKNANHLFVSGLDGTLLNNKTQLTEYACEQLNSIIHDGFFFTVASARSVISIREITNGLSLRLPIIEFGGAFITDLRTGHHHIINNIEPTITNEMHHFFTENGFTPLVTSFNGEEDGLYYETISNEGINWYIINRQQAKDKRLKKVELNSILKDQIVCFTIIDRFEVLNELRDKIIEKYSNHVFVHLKENPFSKGWYWLTIHDKKATKEHAIRWLLNDLGLRNEQLTVFGNKSSDLNMFKISKNRIAVSNAKPELKKVATEIIGYNDKDSVVNYILNSFKHNLNIDESDGDYTT